ncbi:tropomyosin Por p 1.0101-like [Oscarella lobularis]|uniref:tropomyosin Por p 1.0101-like n=1 Tax=Oscarella lobularis TaxID=121494 RepID=UPI003313BC81
MGRMEMEGMKKDLKVKERELGMKENEIKGLENDLKEKNEEMERMAEEMERMKKDLKVKERELGMKENEIKGLENDLKAKDRELGMKDDEIERLRSDMGRDEAGGGGAEMWSWSGEEGAAGGGEMRCALESRTSSDEEPRSLTESWEVPSDEEAAEFPLPTGIPEAIVEEAEETGAAAALPAAPADPDYENDNFGEEEWEAAVGSLKAEDLSEAEYRTLFESKSVDRSIEQRQRFISCFRYSVRGIKSADFSIEQRPSFEESSVSVFSCF